MVSRHITRHSMSGLEAKPLISSTACLSFPPIPSASMQIRTRKNSPICYSLDKTDVGVFLYGPVVDRIESVRIDGKLVSSVFIVIQTAYMTGEILYVFRQKVCSQLYVSLQIKINGQLAHFVHVFAMPVYPHRNIRYFFSSQLHCS